MNHPDRFERFVLPDNVPKVAVLGDTKVKNAATFVIEREDHTVGNTVALQLHRDPEVLFAGYRVPHPLEYKTIVKVHTKGAKDGKGKTPVAAFKAALVALDNEYADLHNQFKLATAGMEGDMDDHDAAQGAGLPQAPQAMTY